MNSQPPHRYRFASNNTFSRNSNFDGNIHGRLLNNSLPRTAPNIETSKLHFFFYFTNKAFKARTSGKPNREEKSLRHVAMVAKVLDDNKLKTSLKK